MKYGLEFAADGWAWGLAIALLAATVWHLWRSRTAGWLKALRAGGAAALVLALLQPALVKRTAQLAKPKLLIFVDQSHSMGGKAGKTDRLQAAAKWLLDHQKQIEERAEPVLYAAAGGAKRLARWQDVSALKPADAALNAGEALREAADDPAAASAQRAWLLTDGNAEPSSDLEGGLAALKTPLDVIGVGPARRERGLAFADLKTPDFAFLHGRFQVQAAIDASDLAGKPVRVTLLREPPSGGAYAPVEERTLTPASDYETLTATFTAAAQQLGSERYRLEASAAGSARTRDFRV